VNECCRPASPHPRLLVLVLLYIYVVGNNCGSCGNLAPPPYWRGLPWAVATLAELAVRHLAAWLWLHTGTAQHTELGAPAQRHPWALAGQTRRGCRSGPAGVASATRRLNRMSPSVAHGLRFRGRESIGRGGIDDARWRLPLPALPSADRQERAADRCSATSTTFEAPVPPHHTHTHPADSDPHDDDFRCTYKSTT
jgi:hypothetical protein